MRSNPNREKRKAHRKKLRNTELLAGLKTKRTIEKWLKDWQESRFDYPVTDNKKKKKPLTKEQYFKFLKNKNR